MPKAPIEASEVPRLVIGQVAKRCEEYAWQVVWKWLVLAGRGRRCAEVGWCAVVKTRRAQRRGPGAVVGLVSRQEVWSDSGSFEAMEGS